MQVCRRCAKVFALFVVVVAGVQHPALAQERPNPCAVPDALLAVGETEQARKHYVALVEQDPSLSCALSGLETINVTPPLAPTPEPASCSEGDQAFDAGDLSASRTAYEEIGQEVKCAETGLAAVRDVERLCRQGGSLAAARRNDDALTAYKAALEKNPEADCAKNGVADAGETGLAMLCSRGGALLARHREEDALGVYKSALERDPEAECAQDGIVAASPGMLSRIVTGISDAIPTILLALFLLLLLCFLLLLLGYVPRIYDEFTRVRYVRTIIRPRLSFSPIDEAATEIKIAGPLLARVRERLYRFREAATSGSSVAPHDDLDFGTPDEEFADLVSGNSALQNSLEKLSGLSDHSKVVAGVVNLLYTWLPIKRLSLSGVLGPPTLKQATITMGLEQDARLMATANLAGPKLTANPDATQYLELGDRAALWTQYVVSQVLVGRIPEPRQAKSYALASRALDLQLLGERENLRQARDLYREALRLNERNWAARVNLAMVEAALASTFETRIRFLEDARTEMEGPQ